jgi:hypothetical protein
MNSAARNTNASGLRSSTSPQTPGPLKSESQPASPSASSIVALIAERFALAHRHPLPLHVPRWGFAQPQWQLHGVNAQLQLTMGEGALDHHQLGTDGGALSEHAGQPLCAALARGELDRRQLPEPAEEPLLFATRQQHGLAPPRDGDGELELLSLRRLLG